MSRPNILCLKLFSFYDDYLSLCDLFIQAYHQVHNWSFNNIPHLTEYKSFY
jgi:hypothetical protein